MDKIDIKGLKVFAYHGVLEEEKTIGQDFYIDACMYFDSIIAGKNDNVRSTINYAEVCTFIYNTVKKNRWNLIETVAENLAIVLMNRYSLINSIKITVNKPHAPIKKEFENISITIERKWNFCAIEFGSNLGDKQKYINVALESINNSKYFKDVRVSPLINTKPYGYVKQDDFLNGALVCKTMYSPENLLGYLQKLENKSERKREIHWGPRTLDLDIILYNQDVINSKKLIVPHADMRNREFVLKPLCELIPSYIHPVYNKSIKDMLDDLKK